MTHAINTGCVYRAWLNGDGAAVKPDPGTRSNCTVLKDPAHHRIKATILRLTEALQDIQKMANDPTMNKIRLRAKRALEG